jgi:hypothetical protein
MYEGKFKDLLVRSQTYKKRLFMPVRLSAWNDSAFHWADFHEM